MTREGFSKEISTPFEVASPFRKELFNSTESLELFLYALVPTTIKLKLEGFFKL